MKYNLGIATLRMWCAPFIHILEIAIPRLYFIYCFSHIIFLA